MTSLISRASIFLPRYSGVRPTIRPPMKTASRTKSSIEYRPAPTPPKIDLAGQPMFDHRHRAAEAGQRLHRRVHRAARGHRRHRRPQRGVGDPEALLLALDVAAGRAVEGVGVDAGGMLGRSAVLLGEVDDDRRRRRRARTSPRRSPSPGGGCRPCARRCKSAPAGITRISSSSTKLVRPLGFSNGIAELTLKKPPPLVPSSLIASCEATGPERERLGAAGQGVNRHVMPPRSGSTPWETRKRAPRIESGSRT